MSQIDRLGDLFADTDAPCQFDIDLLAWSDLLPLALLFQSGSQRTTGQAYNLQSFSYNNSQFLAFLQKWGLASQFGIKIDGEQNTFNDATRVFGVRRFKNKDEIDYYVTRWESPEVSPVGSPLRNRIVTSGAINVICTELISNGIDHTRELTNAQSSVTVLAKLLTVESLNQALKHHLESSHLSATQLRIYQNAVSINTPILELIIADDGVGIVSNQKLHDLYILVYGRSAPLPPAPESLIKFALEPFTTTRNDLAFVENSYLAYLAFQLDCDSVVHGLSEVHNYIRNFNGYWRIQSATVSGG